MPRFTQQKVSTVAKLERQAFGDVARAGTEAGGDPEVKFLIAEDESTASSLLYDILSERGFRRIRTAGNGREALATLREYSADVLITDLSMPVMRGEELTRAALDLDPDLTVVVTTGDGTIQGAVELMKVGIFDFVTKPFSIDKFNATVDRAVDRALKNREIFGISEVIDALMRALESKDLYLDGHGRRVSELAVLLAKKLGWPPYELKLLRYGALMHDVGKIGIPEAILNKPCGLTDEEYEIMKLHPVYSRDILKPVSFLRRVLPYVTHHHERYDGLGYPDGLQGKRIPLGARIIAVADAFDAMSSRRAYRGALSEERILAILEEGKEKQFDPDIVDLLLENIDEFRANVYQS